MNVTEFHFGALKLAFGGRDQATRSFGVVETRHTEQASNKIKEEVESQKAEESQQFYLDHLRLTDPSAYEKLVEGELEDGGAP